MQGIEEHVSAAQLFLKNFGDDSGDNAPPPPPPLPAAACAAVDESLQGIQAVLEGTSSTPARGKVGAHPSLFVPGHSLLGLTRCTSARRRLSGRWPGLPRCRFFSPAPGHGPPLLGGSLPPVSCCVSMAAEERSR